MSMKTSIPLVILLLVVSASPSHAQKHPSDPYPGFEWPNKIPSDCPFEPSDKFAGIYFTGENHSYARADNWVPTWAANGECYSPYTDGTVVNTCAATRGASIFPTPKAAWPKANRRSLSM